MFFLALTYGLETDPLDAVARMVGHVERVGRAHGLESPIQMTLGISDGTRLIGIRYSSAGKSRTLYISRDVAALREIHPKRVEHFSEGARAIVSEPLSSITDAWEAIPESTAIVVTGGSVTSHPFRPASTEPAAESA
jgi:glutamine amidotransferase